MPFQIFEVESRSILSPVSGYLAEAGFTHSLSPAGNCTVPARPLARLRSRSDPAFQRSIVARIAAAAQSAGRDFDHGPRGFGLLAKPLP
jgi:hypothetical protein